MIIDDTVKNQINKLNKALRSVTNQRYSDPINLFHN